MPVTIYPDPHSKFDVFISYRREGGDATALFLREKLIQRGLRVFLDVVELHRGYFDEALLTCIADAPNFLVILSPGALDRCVQPEDWLRQEIAHAIRTKRNIIPVLTRNFTFPAELPEDISTLPRHQGVEYSHMYHTAMIDSILKSIESSPAQITPSSPTPGLNRAPSSEIQDRVLDAAMAAQVPIGKPAELTAMIRRSTSAGLKAVLQIEESDASPEDVRSKPFELEFPLDAQGRAQSAQVTLQINSPDFDPPAQRKVITVPPTTDSETYSFLLTPKFAGGLRINLELCRGDVCLASRLMRTTGTSSDRIASEARVLVSMPIEVKAHGTASIPAPAANTTSAPAEIASPAAFPSSSASARPSPAQSRSSGSFPVDTGSPSRASAPRSPSPSASRGINFGSGDDASAPLAKLFGVGSGDFDRAKALVFAAAWIAGTFVPRVLRLMLQGRNETPLNWFFWLLASLLEVVIILASIRFLRRSSLAGVVAGLGGGLLWLMISAVEYPSSNGLLWNLPWLIADSLQLALFIWILAWVARNTVCRWQALFLGTFAAFFLASLPYIPARGITEDWSWSLLRTLHPHLDLAAAAAFTAIFLFLTKRTSNRR
jgi:hypothetical protein